MIVQVLIFIAMLLLGLLILLGTLTWVMSQMLIAPSRMTDGKAIHLLKRLSPGDLSMAFSDVTFTVRDEQTKRQLKLKGWWIPASANSGHTVILLHGFADAKVGALAWAPVWQSLGYNILAIDLRAHGESDGKYTTAGYFERFDIDQVINDLRTSKPAETQQLVLFGISLGAAVAAAVATKRDDLHAVILDSPYHDYAFAARQHGRYMNLPFGFLSPLAIRLGQWRCGARFEDVAPIKTVQQSKARILIVLGEADPLVDVARFDAIAGENIKLTHFADAGHVLSVVAEPHRYREELAKFLSNQQAQI